MREEQSRDCREMGQPQLKVSSTCAPASAGQATCLILLSGLLEEDCGQSGAVISSTLSLLLGCRELRRQASERCPKSVYSREVGAGIGKGGSRRRMQKGRGT